MGGKMNYTAAMVCPRWFGRPQPRVVVFGQRVDFTRE